MKEQREEAVKRNGSSAVKLLKKCSKKVHLTRKRKCDRIERLTVLGSLFGEKKSERFEFWFINCLLDKLNKM